MNRKIAVLALALLTVTAGCTGSALENTNASSQANAPSQNAGTTQQTVAIAASGQVQTAPDRAVIHVAVTARADSVEDVRQQLAENASQLQTALRKAGLDGDQITSARYDIGRNHRHDEDPSVPKFQGQHAFVVTVNKTERAGEIVVTAVENGATRIENIQFTITQDTRRQLREQALSKAIGNARGKAMVAANGTGLELAGVKIVKTADVSTQSAGEDKAYRLAAANSGGGSAATSFEGGSVTVTANVVVVYNATSA